MPTTQERVDQVKIQIKDNSQIGTVPVTPLGAYKVEQIANGSFVQTVKQTGVKRIE